jgi:LysR family transcriptional regulator, glycine cleavage system transcriptional activator
MTLRSALLPPLAVFVAAARHQNFAHAANELNLTPSAVSHHVRKLEEALGVVLFRRHARGVVLTAEGRLLADAADSAIGDLSAVVDSLRGARHGDRVRLSVLPSFASTWLIPRLAGLSAAHPEIFLEFDSNRAPARFDDSGPDLGIRYGVGPWPGLVSRFLMDDSLLPLASPELAGVEKVRDASDIATLRLLGDNTPEGWREWFRAAGVYKARVAVSHIFNDSAHGLDAAATGLGAILARRRLSMHHLAKGTLIRLPGPELPARASYYIVHPEHRPPSPAAMAFIAWIEREAQVRESRRPKLLRKKSKA